MMFKWSMVMVFLLTISAFGEESNPVKAKPTLQIRPLFQGWSVDSTNGNQSVFSQFSTVLLGQYPVHENVSVALRAAQAITAGDLTDIDGITDLQLMSNFYVSSLGTVFTLNVNVPSGEKGFSGDQLSTSSVLGEYIFRFQVPSFGQGWSVSPGFIWAHPVAEKVVVGLGGTFQYRGRYTPVQEMGGAGTISDFDPGDELLLTLGFDVSISKSSTLSADAIWTTYGIDRWGDLELFDAGNRLTFALQYQKYLRRDVFRTVVRYRSQGKNDVLIPIDVTQTKATDLSRLVPNSIQFLAQYQLNHSKSLAVNFSGEGRYYQDIGRIYSGGPLFSLGLQPQLIVNQNVVLPVHLKYVYGSFIENTVISGVELGIGIQMTY